MEGGRTLTQEEKDAVMRGEYKSGTAEAKTDTTVETKNETEVEEKESTKVEEEVPFDFGVFGKKFGKEIESEDALKSLFEKADKHDEVEKTYSETLEKLNEYKGIAEKFDPLSNFLNEDEYRRQQLLIKKKNELTEDAVKALSVLTPSKVKELSDENALKMQLMVDKELTEKEAELYLQNKYGIEDFADEDIDERIKTVIKVDAKDARKSVAKLYEGIELPTKTDYEAARVQLKQSWEGAVPELIKGIDKIQIAEGIDFVVTDEMKKGLEDEIMSLILSKQIKPSEAAGAELTGRLKDKILISNIGNVAKSMEADLREKIKAETRAALHNDKPLDEGNRNTATQLDNEAKFRKVFK